MLFGFIDPLYLIFALPGFIIALIAEMMVKGTFAKYDHIAASSGMTGAQAAYRLLQDAGINDVAIEETHGFLSVGRII